MIKPLVLISAFVGLSLSGPAHALDVSAKSLANGPFGVSSSLYLSGPVEPGDADKVWDALRTLDLQQPGSNLDVTINSPGGTLIEGLKIGRLLNRLPTLFPITVTSNVGVRGEVNAGPGECASACVLIYLGGTYRFLARDSRIGVHQFFFGDDSGVSSAEATSVSQLLAADVTDYLREVRVHPSMFSTMSQTKDIVWIDRQKLREFGVLNEHVYGESSEYVNLEGVYYLRLWQQSYYGENKIIAGCNEGSMWFAAYLQPPELTRVAEREHKLTLVIDGEEFTPTWSEIPSPTARYGKAHFSVSSSVLGKLAYARRVGARMMIPDEGVFFGFEMDVPNSNLKDTILGCAIRHKP